MISAFNASIVVISDRVSSSLYSKHLFLVKISTFVVAAAMIATRPDSLGTKRVAWV